MLCKCGHSDTLHHHGKSCTGYDDQSRFKFCRCEQFVMARSQDVEVYTNEKGEQTVMAKVKKGRKIVLFEVTAKDGKDMLDKENTSAAALFYRVLVAKGEAMSRVAIYEATKSKCESAAAWERLGHQTHDTLARLRKAGLVKRIETREEVKESVKAASKANGSTKTAKRERKPRKSAPKTNDGGSAAVAEQAAAAF